MVVSLPRPILPPQSLLRIVSIVLIQSVALLFFNTCGVVEFSWFSVSSLVDQGPPDETHSSFVKCCFVKVEFYIRVLVYWNTI